MHRFLCLIAGVTTYETYEVVLGGNANTQTFIRDECLGDAMVALCTAVFSVYKLHATKCGTVFIV